MSKALLTESFGQRLLVIFTALSPFYVEQPHDKGSTLYKYPTDHYKKNLDRSTDPNTLRNKYGTFIFSLIIFSFSIFINFSTLYESPQ
jgi:hypothetical protein